MKTCVCVCVCPGSLNYLAGANQYWLHHICFLKVALFINAPKYWNADVCEML